MFASQLSQVSNINNQTVQFQSTNNTDGSPIQVKLAKKRKNGREANYNIDNVRKCSMEMENEQNTDKNEGKDLKIKGKVMKPQHSHNPSNQQQNNGRNEDTGIQNALQQVKGDEAMQEEQTIISKKEISNHVAACRQLKLVIQELDKQNNLSQKGQMFLQNHGITPQFRGRMIDWLIEVFCKFEMSDKSFFIAIGVLDKYLKNVSRRQEASDIHLLGVVSTFISCKFEEVKCLGLQTVYEKIGHLKLTKDQIKEKEVDMLESIDFDVPQVTLCSLIQQLYFVMNKSIQEVFNDVNLVLALSIYIAKIAIFNYDFIAKVNLKIQAGTVFYLTFKIAQKIYPDIDLNIIIHQMQDFLELQKDDLVSASTQLLHFIKQFNSSGFNNLKTYYSKSLINLNIF